MSKTTRNQVITNHVTAPVDPSTLAQLQQRIAELEQQQGTQPIPVAAPVGSHATSEDSTVDSGVSSSVIAHDPISPAEATDTTPSSSVETVPAPVAADAESKRLPGSRGTGTSVSAPGADARVVAEQEASSVVEPEEETSDDESERAHQAELAAMQGELARVEASRVKNERRRQRKKEVAAMKAKLAKAERMREKAQLKAKGLKGQPLSREETRRSLHYLREEILEKWLERVEEHREDADDAGNFLFKCNFEPEDGRSFMVPCKDVKYLSRNVDSLKNDLKKIKTHWDAIDGTDIDTCLKMLKLGPSEWENCEKHLNYEMERFYETGKHWTNFQLRLGSAI